MNQSFNFNKEIALLMNSKGLDDLTIKDGKIVKINYLTYVITRIAGRHGENAQLVKHRVKEIFNAVVFQQDGTVCTPLVAKEKLHTMIKKVSAQASEDILNVFLNKGLAAFDSKRDENKVHQINLLKRENFKEELAKDNTYSKAQEKKKEFLAQGSNLNEITEAKIEIKRLKMECLYRMGEVGRSEKGATGTTLVFDIRKDGIKRLLGVLKPDAAYAPLSVRIGNVIRGIFGQHSLLSKRAEAQPKAEVISYRASLFFNLEGIPPSRLVEVNNVKGVFQLAAQTYVKSKEGEKEKSGTIKLHEAKELMGPISNILSDPARVFLPAEIEAFQRFIIHDFLIGNLDAHEENWFVKLNEKNEIIQIVGIDKANSFPEKNPSVLGIGGVNQYKWKNTFLAKNAFSDKMKALMRENMSPQKVDAFITEIENKHPEFFSAAMIKLFKERAHVLYEIGLSKNSVTPQQLAKMVTDRDFKLGGWRDCA